ncbi:hypothetical protein [Streptomyces sp. NPDC058985]|uniref:hypothetical protein n=1 Tax=Streptomyces sp. NPDC058985 TaxID=3346684 RepID=UPI0036B8E462
MARPSLYPAEHRRPQTSRPPLLLEITPELVNPLDKTSQHVRPELDRTLPALQGCLYVELLGKRRIHMPPMPPAL